MDKPDLFERMEKHEHLIPWILGAWVVVAVLYHGIRFLLQ